MKQSFETTTAVILAAGQGTRMKSATPKVLHAVCGQPIVFYMVRAAIEMGAGEIVVVVGHGREELEAYLAHTFGDRVKTALQKEQRGTGDAMRAAMPHVRAECESVLVYCGDVPLLTADDLTHVAKTLSDDATAAIAMATCVVDDPTGYGRIVRDGTGHIVEIREHKDLRTDAERAVREMNPGIYAVNAAFLREALGELAPNNAQGEYYLTDIVKMAAERGRRVVGVPSRPDVIEGVNDRHQLAGVERVMAARIVKKWRVEGVTVRDGASIDSSVELARDAVIERGVVLRGKTRVGAGAVIDVGSVLTDVVVEAGAMVKPYTVATSSQIGARAQIGPFSHLRPESAIGEDAHVGNFVETKKTRMDKGAKANHLAYLGDGIIGEGANIGAGTIFCNYDGVMKHTTVIEKGAFIGSDSQLVAPVTVGEGAYVATGTTVTRDVPKDALAIARVKQENKEGYAARLRAKLKAEKDKRT